jgi:Raf kinase inhibitor-like YbhB/YbcL family protein
VGLNIKDLAIASPDVEQLGRLDDRFTYDKGNEPVRLTISGVPEGTAELTVICHDPDAPLPHGFTHWLLYGIPADTTDLGADADQAYRAGTNDFGDTGYGGPLPPGGHGDHHYYFWVYALSRPVEGTPSRLEFLERYGDAIIEQNRLVATYSN